MVNYDSTLFSILILVGGVFSIAAMLLYLFPPKKINYLYGYRTFNSMKSDERWHFAQRFSAIAMLQSGTGLILFSSLGLFLAFSEQTATVIAYSSIGLAVALLIIRTENALKKMS